MGGCNVPEAFVQVQKFWISYFSEAAALVIGGVIPIDFLAKEKRVLYTLGKPKLARRRQTQRRDLVLLRDGGERRGWASVLIRHVSFWVGRGWILRNVASENPGHEYVQSYLYKKGRVTCWSCLCRPGVIAGASTPSSRARSWHIEEDLWCRRSVQ